MPRIESRGEKFARIFRRAGQFLGKGRLVDALNVLEEGKIKALSDEDPRLAALFDQEIRRLRKRLPAPDANEP